MTRKNRQKHRQNDRQFEPEPARERLEAAVATFRRLDARKDAEQGEQALTDLQRG
jgi:hypothetical protein